MTTPPPFHQPPVGHPAHAPTPYPQAGGAPVGPWTGAVNALQCEVCGAAPAVPVTVRGHQGMIVLMRFLRRQGVFCRTCGLAVFREMQANTLLAGWWGPLSMLITPVTLLMNLGARSTLLRLTEPTTRGRWHSLDPGKPVMRRPAGMIALVPLTLLGLAILSIPALMLIAWVAGDSSSNSPKPLTIGSCARNDGSWSDQDLQTAPCDSPVAQFRVTDPAEGCEQGDYIAYPEYSEDGTTSLCLHPLDS